MAMSQTYRRLSEGMPDPVNPMGQRFSTDLKQVKQWVDSLPRANAIATQQLLDQALDNLSSQRLGVGARLALLEEMRPVSMELVNTLERQYRGSALPLPPEKASAAKQAERFHLLLAHGYRKAAAEICAPAGSIPFLKSGLVSQALARAAFHYNRALATAWRVYAAPSNGTWQGLHRVHRFAAELKLDAKPVEDKFAGGAVEINRTYIESLLIAVSNPLAFSQSEQDLLWSLARQYAPRTPLSARAPEENSPVVPEDADRGPGPGAGDEAHSLWLDLRAMNRAVDEAMERTKDGMAELVPDRGVGVRVNLDMLHRLKRSFGLAAARSFKRLPASHQLDTVIGLTAVHYHAAQRQDFDSFVRSIARNERHASDRASWAIRAPETELIPRISAKVLDQSLGGYRLLWANANQARARVGELVGLCTQQTEDDWMLGVVRWLRYESDGGLSAGVELLSRNIAAVALKPQDTAGINETIRALEMRSITDQDRFFVTPSQANKTAARYKVMIDDTHFSHDIDSLRSDLLAGSDVMINAGDYSVIRTLRTDLITDIAEEKVDA
jgi:cyclic-di-GMP-binding protein